MSHARFGQETGSGVLVFLFFGLESQKKKRGDEGINNLFQWFLEVLFFFFNSQVLCPSEKVLQTFWKAESLNFPAFFFAFDLPVHFPVFFWIHFSDDNN